MHGMVVHFGDKTMFFPWVLFIQMHIVINIFLDLLIGTSIQTNFFYYEENCGYLLIKKKLLVIMEF
jgi:hypothetical protein